MIRIAGVEVSNGQAEWLEQHVTNMGTRAYLEAVRRGRQPVAMMLNDDNDRLALLEACQRADAPPELDRLRDALAFKAE